MAMGMAQQIRTVLITARKLALIGMRKSSLTGPVCALLRRILAFWRTFQTDWMKRLWSVAITRSVGDLSESPSENNTDKTITVYSGIGARFESTQSEEVISLEGVAYSLYPHSHGSHGNSWPSVSQHARNLSVNASVHDLPNQENSVPSSFLPNTTLPTARNSVNLHLGVGEPSVGLSASFDSPPYLHHPSIKPMMPEDTNRYDAENRKYRSGQSLDIDIDLLHSPLLHKPTPSEGWSELTYPEGGRYFYNNDKRLYTEADIYDAKVLDRAMEDASAIEDFISKNSVFIPENAELVLDICRTGDDWQTSYYFVNHDARGIFFLDPYQSETVSINTPGQLRHHVEAQYWYHISLFPHSLVISKSLVKELKDMVLFFVSDTLTSTSSTSPYETDVLYKILDITAGLEQSQSFDNSSVGAACLVARFMYMFAESRYWNHAGEAHARLSRDQSIYGELNNRRNWAIWILSAVLFFAPNVYSKNIQKMWVDQIAYGASWKHMFEVLNSEWKGHILLAAIMVNANVGFLSTHGWVIHLSLSRSPMQIASYVSMATNVGSIVMGMLLVKQTSGKHQWKDASTVQKYLNNHQHPQVGLEVLAILYSLPYAFLMWGILYFLAALGFACFQHSNNSTRVIIASLCAPMIVLSWWSYTSWGKLLKNHTVQDIKPYKAQSTDTEARSLWSLPANQWMVSAFSKLRRQSYTSEKTTVV